MSTNYPDALDSLEYIYNGEGLKIKKKDKTGIITNYYWLSKGLMQVLNETDDEDNLIASYILDKRLIGIVTESSTKYYLTDG
jgi:hypothetical protein